jgi:5-methyltetrahydrofolate--homocysteine methyltransferase
VQPPLQRDYPAMDLLAEIAAAVIRGDAAAVDRLTDEALRAGEAADVVLDRGLTAAMAVIGRRFRANEIFVPEVLVAARAMKAGLARLEPVLAETGVPPVGTCVIGTVQGDIHDIGKNLVAMMLRGAGFAVVDLGVNVPAQAFAEAVRTHSPQIVGLSALLTTTMVQMQPTIAAVRDASAQVRVMVGGAPVSVAFAAEIGADAYGANAGEAVDVALRFVGRAPAS